MKRILANLEHYKYWYLAAILLIALGVQFLIPSRPGKITESNFSKIEKGMTRADVEEILGPGADVTAHPERLGWGGFDGIGPRPHLVWKYWDGDEGTIAVAFAGDEVSQKEWRRAVSLWE